MATDAEILGLAKEGKCDEIFQAELKRPSKAYLWLLVARNFGYTEADDRLSDLVEVTDLRYDDDGFQRMAIQLELANAYLKGELGLEVSPKLGLEHLGEFMDVAYHGIEGQGLGDLERLASELSGEARSAVEAFRAQLPFWVVRRRLERLESFFQMKWEGHQVPTVIEEHELKELQAEIAELVRFLNPSASSPTQAP